MPHPRFSGEEIGKLGRQWYEQSIRTCVETPENIGKFVEFMDVHFVEDGQVSLDLLTSITSP